MCTFKQSPCLVILYAVFASYFAGVMVRLILTLTPVVCIGAAIIFSETFANFIVSDASEAERAERAADEESAADAAGAAANAKNSKNKRLYDKVCIVFLIYEFYT